MEHFCEGIEELEAVLAPGAKKTVLGGFIFFEEPDVVIKLDP